MLPFSLAENLALRDYRRAPLSRFGWLSPKRMTQQAEPLLEQYDVRGGEPGAGQLALGGQRAEGRDRARARRGATGHDRGAADARARRRRIEFVHRGLLEQRDGGGGVLLVRWSSRIRSLSDRVLAIYEGRIVAELSPDALDEELAWRCRRAVSL